MFVWNGYFFFWVGFIRVMGGKDNNMVDDFVLVIKISFVVIDLPTFGR